MKVIPGAYNGRLVIHISRPSIYPTRSTVACVKVSSRKVHSRGSVVPAITHQLLDSAGFKYNHSTRCPL